MLGHQSPRSFPGTRNRPQFPRCHRAAPGQGSCKSEERFRQLAEHIGAVFWLCEPDLSRVIYVSPAYEPLWKRTCQSLYDDPLSFSDSLHPEDSSVLRLKQHLHQGTFQNEYRIVHPDGSVHWLWTRSFAIRDSRGRLYRIAGITHDITERKKIEESLWQSEYRLRLVTGTMRDALLVYDREGSLLFANPAAETLFGCPGRSYTIALSSILYILKIVLDASNCGKLCSTGMLL